MVAFLAFIHPHALGSDSGRSEQAQLCSGMTSKSYRGCVCRVVLAQDIGSRLREYAHVESQESVR